MPTNKDFAQAVQVVLSRHQRYSPEAYYLLDRAMEFACQEFALEGHLCAEQVYLCYCKLAQMEYGPLAREVLEHWGVRTPSDLGAIVYHLIETQLFKKRDGESQRDFDHLPDLQIVLDRLIADDYNASPFGKKHFFYPSP